MSTGSALVELLADTVTTDPSSVAVIDGGPDPIRVTRAELSSRVLALHDDLRAHGVGEGDCVGVWLPNWSDALVIQTV
ncbi:hypothetical protein [Streptomyces malaysiensis]|uniref:hypothetical protein n=1 Tax=Streptomyces malaysiensis TaxID=92644 RepID=UPI003716DD8D